MEDSLLPPLYTESQSDAAPAESIFATAFASLGEGDKSTLKGETQVMVHAVFDSIVQLEIDLSRTAHIIIGGNERRNALVPYDKKLAEARRTDKAMDYKVTKAARNLVQEAINGKSD